MKPVAVLALLVLAACSSGKAAPKATTASASASPTPTTIVVSGDLTLSSISITDPAGRAAIYIGTGNPCLGAGGYSDIAGGAQVVIADASGKTVALGHLFEGSEVDKPIGCVFQFAVSAVPDGLDFYQVTIANRKPVQFTAAEVHSQDGLHLTLG